MRRSKTLHSDLQMLLPLFEDVPFDIGDEYEDNDIQGNTDGFTTSLEVYKSNGMIEYEVKDSPESWAADYFGDITERHVEILHTTLFEKSLQQLFNSRSSKELVVDALAWVNFPLNIGKGKAFSFYSCCVFSGYNPEEMQSAINDRLVQTRPDFQ